MTKMSRRDRLKIYRDLLAVLNEEASDERTVLIRVQLQMNVPFDRLKKYISELKNLGLVQGDISIKLTEKGKQYLIEYEKVLDFIKRMGITYR